MHQRRTPQVVFLVAQHTRQARSEASLEDVQTSHVSLDPAVRELLLSRLTSDPPTRGAARGILAIHRLEPDESSTTSDPPDEVLGIPTLEHFLSEQTDPIIVGLEDPPPEVLGYYLTFDVQELLDLDPEAYDQLPDQVAVVARLSTDEERGRLRLLVDQLESSPAESRILLVLSESDE